MRLQYVFLARKSERHPELLMSDVGYLLGGVDSNVHIRFLRVGKDLNILASCVTNFDIHRTGDRFEFKVCDRCFRRLHTEKAFSDNRRKKGDAITKRPSCKECRKKKDGVPIETKVRGQWASQKPRDYDPFLCPICNKTTITKLSKIVLDHCHKTGRPRGYICESCNTGIGRFDDNPTLIKRALEWVLKFQNTLNLPKN